MQTLARMTDWLATSDRTTRALLAAFAAGCIALGASLRLWPVWHWYQAVAGYTAAVAICAALYRRCSWAGAYGAVLLVAMVTLSTCGVVANVSAYTMGGMPMQPILVNWDYDLDWSTALCDLNGQPLPVLDGGRRSYAILIAWLCRLCGTTIVVPLMANVAVYGVNLVLMGKIAYAATRSPRVARVTMAIAALMCYLWVQSTVLIKDQWLVMALGISVLCMLRWHRRRATPGSLLIAAGAVALAGWLRPALMPLTVCCAIILGARQRQLWPYLVLIMIAAGVYITTINALNQAPVDPTANLVAYDPAKNPRHAALTALIGDFNGGDLLKKLLWTPAAVVMQFLVPFPWHFGSDIAFAATMPAARVAYPWYAAGGILLWWMCAGRRPSPRLLQRLVWCGILLTVLTAYETHGSASRYCLPYLPMLLPAVAWTLCHCTRRRSLWIWIAVYAVLLAAALIICHHLHSAYA